jgi:drug/metabolite transporter (DMT)-like permease
LGESGSAVFFLLATHYIAAAEANLILYLWPVMVVGLGAALRIFRLRTHHVVGIASGLTGAGILTHGGGLSVSYVGILLAGLGGVSWALYCVFRLVWTRPTGPLLARGFGISTILCGSLHLFLEPSILPSIGSAAAAAIIGIVPSAFANLAWDEGFRRGDSHLLAVMAYATPLCSTLLLIALGFESFTASLFAAAILIVVGGILSRTTV